MTALSDSEIKEYERLNLEWKNNHDYGQGLHVNLLESMSARYQDSSIFP